MSLIISILIGLFLSLISLITTIGNLIVLLAFYYDQKLRTVNDYFIMNMAIADFLVGFFCIPFYIPFSIKQSWPFGKIFCKIWVTVDDVSTMASVINIVAISFNRYWLIAYPISYRKYLKQYLVYSVMAAIWIISFINFAPGIWLIGLFVKSEDNVEDCSGDYNRSFVYMLIAQINYFICPFLLLCILNLLIMFNIWKRTRKISRIKSSKLISKSKEKYPNEQRNLFIQQYSPIIQDKSLNNYLDQPNKSRNLNLSKDSSSYPSTPSPSKLISITYQISSNNKNHLTIDYNSKISLRENENKDEQIKETVNIKQKDHRIRRDRKAARSLFILVFVFLIFLFPYVICATASTAGLKISKTLFEISFWLLWINSTCNPFIYPLIQIKYRRAYHKLFKSFTKNSL